MTDHYLVIDLEATCCNDDLFPRHEMEIIEIGAVMVPADTQAAVSEFQTFIKPVRHAELTDFCRELTTITQHDVDSAPGFIDAMQSLTEWAAEFAPYTFCSWGDYDRKQFLGDCQFHKIPFSLGDAHINLKKEFSTAGGFRRRMGLAQALKKSGLTLEGTHHRGIDDARNIAALIPQIFPASD